MRAITTAIAFLFLGITANAAEIRFQKNMSWKQVLQLAKNQNKIIFFDAFASWCGPCKYMERSVYTDAGVAAYFNANFINVKMDMETGEGPALSDKFAITAYPTFLFIDATGKVIHKSMGAMEPPDFVQLGKDAKDPATRYFGLHERVKNKTISDAQFLKWVGYARKLREEGLAATISEYLAGKKDLLENEYAARVALKYADDLDDDQLRYLVKNESRLIALFRTDPRGAWKAIYDKLFSIGLKAYNSDKDVDAFKAVFAKFDPSKQNVAVKDLEIQIALYVREDSEEAAAKLVQYLADPKDALTVTEVTEIFVDQMEEFSIAGYKKLAAGLSNYQARNKADGALVHFLLAVCRYAAGDDTKALENAKSAIADGSLPEKYKTVLKSLFRSL
jgi:thiol-disulfide isomerase/thioredoxin